MSLQGGGSNDGKDAPRASSSSSSMSPMKRLRTNPNTEHDSDDYEDLKLDFTPLIFSSLERYLPPAILTKPREEKVKFMRDILINYLPLGKRCREAKHQEYRLRIISNYQPLHPELYSLNPTFFVPAFLKAINDNTEESFRSIMSEVSPGIFVFEMFQPRFCELLLAEVENFENWVTAVKFRIMRPNILNKYGVILDDFGFGPMLDKLMKGLIRPISRVFFPEVGGSTLDSHHGYVVEYGTDKDLDLGFHVDNSEVTLNVCLGKQFSGGELYFRGIRCDKHLNTGTPSEEMFDYSHVPGRALLHRGRHRHGVKATTSGHRVNLILWCRSSVFREKKKHHKDFSSWCGECNREKIERQRSIIAATRSRLFRRGGASTS